VNEPKSAGDVELDDALNRLERKVSRDESQPVSHVNAFSVVAFLMAFLALGGAGYSVYVSIQQQTNSPYDEKVLGLQGTLKVLEQQLDSTVGSSNLLQATQKSQAEQIELLQNQIAEVISEVHALDGTSSRDWLLAEVEYLLKLANQRVIIEKEIDTATGLLVSADKILERTEGIAAFELRNILANDIANLKAVGDLDRDGIYLQLGAMINQVISLKQKELSFQTVTDTDAVTEIADVDAQESRVTQLETFVSRLFERLQQLLDFRRGTERVQPILPPAEEYYLRQNLILKLEQAQIGMLKGNQAVFEYALGDSKLWLDNYFEPTDPLTQSMTATLIEMSNIQVERELPDISSSLIKVRELLADFHQASDSRQQESPAEVSP
jgi:uroporphyrin-3 C-methyltransferase